MPPHDIFECSFEQLKKIVAALIAGAFVLFVSGYYLGKKTATESLMAEVESVAFADRIYSSLCTLYPSCSQEQEGPDAPEVDEVSSETNNDGDVASQAIVDTQGEKADDVDSDSSVLLQNLYYAPLAGYGTHQAAVTAQKRFEFDGVKTIIVEKPATSARGKKRLWYQIVTKPYKKEELERLIQKIKKPYKLTDIDILEYKEKD